MQRFFSSPTGTMSNPFSYSESSANNRSNRNSYMRAANAGNYGQVPVEELPPNGFSPQQPQQQAHQSHQYAAHNRNSSSEMPSFFQDPRAQVAYQFGQKAFSNFFQSDAQNPQEQQQPGGGLKSAANLVNNTSFFQLAYYFQVSNSYVFHKIKIIVLPFVNKTWYRVQDDTSNSDGSTGIVTFLPPRLDVNCPDMYIPVMGMITYILGCNLEQGFKGSYDPQNLYYKLSSTLAFVLLDLFILKLGLYLIIPNAIQNTPTGHRNGPGTTGVVITTPSSGSLLELLCFVGYKFVPLTAALFMRQSPVFSKLIFTAVRLYLFLGFGVFLLRSVKFNLLFPFVEHQTAVNFDRKSVIKKCNYFLFFYGFIWQVLLMWLMG